MNYERAMIDNLLTLLRDSQRRAGDVEWARRRDKLIAELLETKRSISCSSTKLEEK